MGETDGDEAELIPTFVQRLAAGSSVVAAIRRGWTALSDSKLSNVADRAVTATRNSYLYRWLTKEPEPEVIVIDLRETYTVGPFIRLLDAILDRIEPYWHESLLKQSLVAVEKGVDRLAQTRVGQIVASVLAPPEPPEQDDAAVDMVDETESDDDDEEQTA